MAQTITRGPVTTADRDSALKRDAIRRKVYRQEPSAGFPTVKILKQIQRSGNASNRREISWYRYPYDPRYGTVLDVYTDQLSAAYTTGGSEGDTLFVALAEADAKSLVAKQVLFLASDSYPGKFVAGQIQTVVVGSDTTSYVTIKLIEDDDDDLLAETDLRYYIGGNAQEDLSGLPDFVRKEPVESSNIMQLFMETVMISGTELAEQMGGSEVLDTRGFTEDQRRARQKLMEDMEWAILFGRYLKSTGAHNRPLHFMRGLVTAVEEEQSDNVFDYKTSTDYTGKRWDVGGWPFLKDIADQVSRYGSTTTFPLWVGDLAFRGINDAIEGMGNFNMEPLDNEFGIRVNRLHGFQSTIDIMQHPMFSTRPALRRCGFLWAPNQVSYVPLTGRDVQPVGSEKIAEVRREGHTWIDGHVEGLLAQFTIRYDGLENFAFIKNIGVDNPGS